MSATIAPHEDPLLGFEVGFGPIPRRVRRRRRKAVVVLSAAVAVVAVLVGGVAFKFVVLREKAAPASLADAAARGQGALDVKVAGGAAPGVYRAQAEGRRTFSVGGLVAEDGPEVPVSVTHRDTRCWGVRLDYSTTVHEIGMYCLDGGRVVSGGTESRQRWDLGVAKVTIVQQRTCDQLVLDDGAAAAGSSWHASCRVEVRGELEGSDQAPAPPTPVSYEVTHTFVGTDAVTIDGRSVETRHYRQESTAAGDTVGKAVHDLWFSRDDHSLVKMTRRANIELKAGGGAATITDDGSWTLASTTGVS